MKDELYLILLDLELLQGQVLDAEALLSEMRPGARRVASERIADWKRRYAGMPHGQWDGGSE